MRILTNAVSLFAIATLAAACTMQPPPAPLPAPAPTPPPMAGSCNATGVQSAVGQVASAAVLEQVTLGSGAMSARVVHPGEVVTMEFNANRLTINVDGANRIVDLRCG